MPIVSGSSGGTARIDSFTAVVGDATIKALPTTPAVLLPFASLGSGTICVPLSATFHLLWAANYTNIGSTSLVGIEYGTELASPLLPFREAAQGDVTKLLAAGGSHIAVMPQLVSIEGAADVSGSAGTILLNADTVGASLRLYAVNSGSATGNFTGGNAGNFLTVVVSYTTFTP